MVEVRPAGDSRGKIGGDALARRWLIYVFPVTTLSRSMMYSERIQENTVIQPDVAVRKILEDTVRDAVTHHLPCRVDEIAGFREERADSLSPSV